MDTAWDDEGNILRGINFIGKENLTYGRISFQVMDKVNADGTLSDRQIGYLRSRLQHISLSNPKGVLLNSDPVDINVETFTHHPEEWYKVIKATTKYAMDYGLNVVSIAPFNEPDITASNQGTKDDFKAVAKLIKEDPFFDGIRICAGNTCNNDGAMEWYDYMKPYVDEGNTHQLAGDFDHYAYFYTHVKADGNVATNDELHNVMEGIVGAQYGMENGIWWGTVGPSRGDFCIATSPGGSRLGYAENRKAWTGAAVYRMPDGRIKGFAVSQHLTKPGTIIPAGQGVVLKANPGVYTMIPTTKKKTKDPLNKLQGSDTDQLTRGGNFYYTLNENADGQLHWNWVATDGATFINPAHKAYLVSKKDTQTPTISLETITAISRIQADGKSHAKGTYNLAGQRVDDTYPSIIITDGKKILPKKR